MRRVNLVKVGPGNVFTLQEEPPAAHETLLGSFEVSADPADQLRLEVGPKEGPVRMVVRNVSTGKVLRDEVVYLE